MRSRPWAKRPQSPLGTDVAPLTAKAATWQQKGAMMTRSKIQSLLVATLLALAAAAVPVHTAAAADCSKLKNTQFPNNTRITLVEQVTPDPVWVYPPSLFTTAAERLANGPTGAEKPFCRV